MNKNIIIIDSPFKNSGLVPMNFDDVPLKATFVYQGEFYQKFSNDSFIKAYNPPRGFSHHFKPHEDKTVYVTSRMYDLCKDGWFKKTNYDNKMFRSFLEMTTNQMT